MWKVMAADDEAYVRQALQELIPWTELGCALCKTVCDGQELVEEMEQEHPDIIVTDIRMPRLDGLEVCRYVKDHCPEAQIIILSAYSDFSYARAALRGGACEYILKTDLVEELPRAVKKAAKLLAAQQAAVLEEAPPSSAPMALYDQMARYVAQNYRRNITLQDLAGHLHASQSYLSRLYKSCSGSNLFDDILRRRIEKAKECLMAADWKIQDVAAYVGFEDAAYFSKVFKRYAGVTPKEFRYARNQQTPPGG